MNCSKCGTPLHADNFVVGNFYVCPHRRCELSKDFEKPVDRLSCDHKYGTIMVQMSPTSWVVYCVSCATPLSSTVVV
jgi:hypothetical protein